MLKNIPCPDCKGNGFISEFTENSVLGKKCFACDGLGYVEVSMTNADRIRGMSDEELAEWLILFVRFTLDENGIRHGDFVDREREKLLVFLKQPAEEE